MHPGQVSRAAGPGRPDVHVLVVAYEGREETAALLAQLAQWLTVAPTVRVSVWDNLGWELPAPAGVDYTPSASNIGFGAAVNRLAERSRSDWLLLVNADVSLTALDLAVILGRLEPLPPRLLWAPTLTNPDGSPQTLPGQLFLRSTRQEVLESFGVVARRRPHQQEYLRGAVLAVPRALFTELGGFDEQFFLYGEEVDLCLRAQRAGARLVLDPTVRIRHDGSQGLYSKSSAAAGHYLAAKVKLTRKQYGRASAQLVHWSVVLGTAARVLGRRLPARRRREMLSVYGSAVQDRVA